MKIYQKEIKIETKGPYDFIDITDKVNEIVKESGIKNGIVSLFSLHNTACIIIQDNDETIFKDIEGFLIEYCH